jgi:hypothetical protein
VRTIYDTRRDNLRALIGQWGGPTSLSKKLGHSNGSYIAQLAGPRPSREVSEKVAREIEQKLGLPVAWMDQDHPAGGQQLNDETLTECVKAVATCLRDAGLRPGPDAYATLVQLVYDRVKLTGRLDEQHIQKLTTLLRGGGR